MAQEGRLAGLSAIKQDRSRYEFMGLGKQKFSALNFKYFLTHYFYHVFWVFKRTVSLRRFF